MAQTNTSETRNPIEHIGCSECGANHDTWEKHRSLPQVGRTFKCSECGREVYVYDAGDRGQVNKQWRAVTDQMAMSLLFYDEVGEWPDSELEPLFKQGVERAAAIDYHIVEEQGVSQTEWANRTERKQPTVSQNVSKAKSVLQ